MIKAAQEYPVEAMALGALWEAGPPFDGVLADNEEETPSEFLTDLAERIASLCVQPKSEPGEPPQAVPLRRDGNALDRYCRLQLAYSDGPVLIRPEIMLYTSDGNVRSLCAIEADVIRLAISRYGGRISEVARRLNIGRSTLYRKLEELGISYTNYRPD